ncbi:unnamed protein product [Cylicocyclus nassatus]|uniref:Sodium/calcium exchanger membrane region domain-containing protein n=1 Tax=Cylicocyclus nassatus TaxID=53992 RepID=A0AA36GSU2_CYLNA|nr:unnamed protein product [Cylicocyclus nassatus]
MQTANIDAEVSGLNCGQRIVNLQMLYLFIFVTWFLRGDAAETTTLIPTDFEEDPEVCQVWNMTEEAACEYVKQNKDVCEGGGYLQWSQYVECEFVTGKKIGTIIAGVVWLLVLFAIMSATADDFFSPNIAAIVAHLKISESIAGVTFMAFGNGAPDIFGSIASVLNSPKPKAGIALGQLLGAGIFDTSVVTAAIILIMPFKADVLSTIRNLIFFLIAACMTLVFLFSTKVYIWEPAGYLALYVVYILTVILGHYLHKRRRMKLTINNIKSKQSIATYGSVDTVIPNIQTTADAVERFKRLGKQPSNIFITLI